MRLPISVFEYETGINYKADIPMAILGEVPKPVYSDADRQRELKLLKKQLAPLVSMEIRKFRIIRITDTYKAFFQSVGKPF